MRAADLRDLVLLHTGVARRLDAVLAARPRPAVLDRVAVVGPDPVRVLLTGAGLAVGYGVESAEDGLGGALARALAGRLQRGVVLEHRVQPGLSMPATVELLGGSGAHTYDLVVWCPTFTEVTRTIRLRRWVIELRRIMNRLIETGDRRTSYVLTGFPLIEDPGVLEQVASTFVNRVNARIASVAREFPRTAFATPPAAVGIGHALTADYYVRAAEHLLPAALAQLRPSRTPTD